MRFFPLIALLGLLSCSTNPSDSDHLVILHTNDTHSAIDPDRYDRGGIARRKVLIDSVRDAHENVLLIDAGDAVQGSLYYTIFGGEVERKMMNHLGYDIQILGNHEFDNGSEPLAREWSQLNADRISSNYTFDSISPLRGLFVPSVIKEFQGRKVGFLGINLDPHGIISEENYAGITYHDAIKAANEEAANLRAKGVDMVIAVTHIGYDMTGRPDDIDLAQGSKDIDVIIGGHSHTTIDPADTREGVPAWRIANAEGDTVTVLQTGSSGTNLGEIDINLATGRVEGAKLIPVDSRLDSRLDPEILAAIAPYREKVEAMRTKVIGTAPYDFDRKSTEMLNLLSDFVAMRGAQISGKPVDIAIMNKGGIRHSLHKGDIRQGDVIDIAPFNNRVVVMEIKGSDLLDNLAIMAAQEGNGVSKGVSITFDPSTHAITEALIGGNPIDPKRTYRLATIDYLAAGNDYMEPLTRGTILAKSPQVLYQSLIDNISAGNLDSLLNAPDTTPRMTSF